MDIYITQLIHEVERANLAEAEVQQVVHFIRFLHYQRRFMDLPLAVSSSQHGREIAQENPLLTLSGMASVEPFAAHIDDELYQL